VFPTQGRRYRRFAMTRHVDATSSHRPNRSAGSARRYLLIASFLAASHTAKALFSVACVCAIHRHLTLSLWPFQSNRKASLLQPHPFLSSPLRPPLCCQTTLHHRVRLDLLLGESLLAHTFFACSFNHLTITTTDLLQQSSQPPCSYSEH
jgi:hypothetical protein